jgi:hypothetical protein
LLGVGNGYFSEQYNAKKRSPTSTHQIITIGGLAGNVIRTVNNRVNVRLKANIPRPGPPCDVTTITYDEHWTGFHDPLPDDEREFNTFVNI